MPFLSPCFYCLFELDPCIKSPLLCLVELTALMNRLSRGVAGCGVDDGTRTHDDRNHNPGLYQLSYAHH